MSEMSGGFPARTQASAEALRLQHVIGGTLIRHTRFIGQAARFLTDSFSGSGSLFRGLFRSRLRMDRENFTQPQGNRGTR
jgi:hypothetical protein